MTDNKRIWMVKLLVDALGMSIIEAKPIVDLELQEISGQMYTEEWIKKTAEKKLKMKTLVANFILKRAKVGEVTIDLDLSRH
jgi:hypothetical protein